MFVNNLGPVINQNGGIESLNQVTLVDNFIEKIDYLNKKETNLIGLQLGTQ